VNRRKSKRNRLRFFVRMSSTLLLGVILILPSSSHADILHTRGKSFIDTVRISTANVLVHVGNGFSLMTRRLASSLSVFINDTTSSSVPSSSHKKQPSSQETISASPSNSSLSSTADNYESLASRIAHLEFVALTEEDLTNGTIQVNGPATIPDLHTHVISTPSSQGGDNNLSTISKLVTDIAVLWTRLDALDNGVPRQSQSIAALHNMISLSQIHNTLENVTLTNVTISGNSSIEGYDTSESIAANYAPISGGSSLSTFGIGTSTPWDNASFAIEQDGVRPTFVIGDNGTSTPTLYINAKGNIGIGTSNPLSRLSIDTSGSNTNPFSITTNGSTGNYTATNSALFFYDAAGTEILRIHASDPDPTYFDYNVWNLYIGRQAGYNQPSDNVSAGWSNTGVGYQALYSNTTGCCNNAFGTEALYSNVSGERNDAYGRRALYSNISGSFNIAIGYTAGELSTGSNNIFLGYTAGDNITTGSNNLIIGYNIDAPSATLSNQLAIGNLIFGTGIDGTGTTLSTGNIGIGTTTPARQFSVEGDSIITGSLKTGPFTSTSTLIVNGIGTSTFTGGIFANAFRTNLPSCDTANKLVTDSNGAIICATEALDGAYTGTYDGNDFVGGVIGLGDILYGSAAGSIQELSAGTRGTILSITTGGIPGWVSTSTFAHLNAANVFTSTGNNTFVGRIGIGTTTPGSLLSIANRAGLADQKVPLFTVASSTASATTTLFTILNNGNVGVGSSTPTHQFHVMGSQTGTINTENSALAYIKNSAVSGSGDSAGLYVDASSATGAADRQTGLIVRGSWRGIDSWVYRIGDIGYITGNTLGAELDNGNASSIDGLYVPSTYYNYDGNSHSLSSNLTGISVLNDIEVYDAAGSITIPTVYGIRNRMYTYTDSGGSITITNRYGEYIESGDKDGTANVTVTNNYALYLENQVFGSTNYAIYSAGGQSYFAGNIGIGTTTPSEKLAIAGHLVLDNTSTAASIFVNNGAICADNGDVDECQGRSLTAGVVYGDSSSFSGADIAEKYEYAKGEKLKAGDIVSINEEGKLIKATREHPLLGVISTDPGVLLNDLSATSSPVALAGRVPTTVSLENGSIKPGDYITISSKNGIGAKATSSTYVVGIAMEGFDGKTPKGYTQTGIIHVFVNLGYAKIDMEVSKLAQSITSNDSQPFIIDQNSGRITTSYTLNMAGRDIINVRNILGQGGVWSIDESGTLRVRRIEAESIRVQELEVGKGITTKDRTTGAYYCVFIDNGSVQTMPGTCQLKSNTSINSSANESPAVTTTPIQQETTVKMEETLETSKSVSLEKPLIIQNDISTTTANPVSTVESNTTEQQPVEISTEESEVATSTMH
jgi:hypothetical protein